MSPAEAEHPYLDLGIDVSIQKVCLRSPLRGTMEKRKDSKDAMYSQQLTISNDGRIKIENQHLQHGRIFTSENIAVSIDPGIAAFMINRMLLILSNSSSKTADMFVPVWDLQLWDQNGKVHRCRGPMWQDPSYCSTRLSKYIRETFALSFNIMLYDPYYPEDLVLFDGGKYIDSALHK